MRGIIRSALILFKTGLIKTNNKDPDDSGESQVVWVPQHKILRYCS